MRSKCSMGATLAVCVLLAAGAQARAPAPAPEQVDRRAVPAAKLDPTPGEAAALLRLLRGMEHAVAELESSKHVFHRPEKEPLTPDEREQVLQLWASLIDYEIALDLVKDRYRESWFGKGADDAQTRSFVVAYAAYVGQLRASMAIIDSVTGKPAYEKLLNEPQPSTGVGAGHLDRIKKHALAPRTALILRAGRDYGETLLPRYKEAGVTAEGPLLELLRYSRKAWATTDKLYWKRGVALAAKASLTMMKDEAFKAVFPAQKGIAGWLGDTKVHRSGKYLVSLEQLDALEKKLEPGDIVVARKNWYLSNIGLPGFWPHAELYTGTPEKLRAYFDADPEVKKAFPEGFVAHLEKSFPKAFAHLAIKGEGGEPPRILEAISEGVVFSTLPEAVKADYVGVMRPRRSKLEKARAIARGFAHFGKPYDFDFDFLTDSTLVCSELVYKAYQAPADEGRSLDVPLVRVAGRTTLPANELVKKFDIELGTPKQELEFVAFLDGREGQGKAVEGTLEDFRASHRRIKWDIAQR